jgi:hypothetical protein
LPPDAHQSIVLQVTTGAGDAGTVSPLDEFEEHARRVAALLGTRVRQCSRLYFSGGSTPRRGDLEQYLEIARRVPFAIGDPSETTDRSDPTRAFDLMLDDLSDPQAPADCWPRWVALGLGRLTIHLGSADRETRSRGGLSGDPAIGCDVASIAKTRGAAIRVVVWSGVASEGHLGATIDALRAMPLDRKDTIYVVDAAEVADWAERRVNDSARNGDSIRLQLAAALPPTGAKVVCYTLEKQWN